MTGLRLVQPVLVAAVLLAVPSAARAQAQTDAQALRKEIEQLRQELQAIQKQYGDRLTALESKLGAAEGAAPAAAAAPPGAASQAQSAQVPPGAEGAGGPSGALPLYGAGSASSKIFNPDMAVIGNFLGAAGRNRVNPIPALEMKESEVSLQAIVDPYARADFFIAFGEADVDLEEGFITFPTLPGGFLAKVGKQRAAFGKVNSWR
jgi:hypothetical protein